MTDSPEKMRQTRPAYLIFEFERRAYPIGADTFTIGRASSCDIVVREPAVSRIHAQLTRTPDGVTITPMGATATIVNGLPAPGETLLQQGDEIDIGSARLTFNELSLPLGVSIIDQSRRSRNQDDADTRRPTITNPLLAGRSNPDPPRVKKFFRPAVIITVLAVLAAYYFGVMLR